MGATQFIGQVARAAGVSVHTVRYYERVGVLAAPPRTASRYRVYSNDVVERLRFIRQAQALGFRLGEIKEVLRLKYAGRSPCECVRALLRAKLEQVEKQMAELKTFRQQLRRTLEGSARLPRLPHSASAICPIIENSTTRRQAQ